MQIPYSVKTLRPDDFISQAKTGIDTRVDIERLAVH